MFGRKGARSGKIWHVVIYDMNRVKRKQTDLATELKNLGIPILKVKDLLWFIKRSKRIDTQAKNFLSNLCTFLEDSDHSIITYGDSLKEADRISDLFGCDTRYLTDQFGILKQFEIRIRMRETQKKVYNNPPRTLQDPTDLIPNS